MKKLLAAMALLTTCAVTSVTAQGVNPDELRERTRPPETREQVTTRAKEDPAPRPHEQAAALSEAFKKYATMRMLAWRASPSSSIMFLGQFNSEAHCAAARKTLMRQIVKLGWGRAECLEIVLQ